MTESVMAMKKPKMEEQEQEMEFLNDNDRISLLPDSLLLQILSSLNTKEVVQTCVISKRWKTLWTRITALNFDADTNPYAGETSATIEDKSRTFKKFVAKFVSQHQGTHIRKLYHFGCTNELSLIDFLIRYAQRCNVQELSINTRYMGYYDWMYLYSTCSSLVSLTMVCGFVDDWGALVSPSLKVLEIDCGWSNGTFGQTPHTGIKTFSGCPNLESLVLVDYHVDTLTICAPKLKNLELCAFLERGCFFPEVELLTPCLENVYFSNVLPTVKSTSSELLCIQKVNIEVELSGVRGSRNCRQKSAAGLFELLGVFHNAKSFTLPLKEMQVYKVVSSVPSLGGITFHNLKHLKIKTGTTKRMKRLDMPISLMALKCPNLETLDVINEINYSRALTDACY